MSDNLKIYEAARTVPPEAQKTIKGGRLSGMTDINPMWRIKQLTELFGPCGFGWKYEITEKRLEQGANDEIAAFVDINLYIHHDGKWSEPIPGTGGSTFVAKESRGLHTSDECFKMALTDAISVACKSLGFGADVYWDGDSTKYNSRQNTPKNTKPKPKKTGEKATEAQCRAIYAIGNNKDIAKDVIKDKIRKDYEVDSTKDLTKQEASAVIEWLNAL